jgi:ABC-type sugar transport system permease subunit
MVIGLANRGELIHNHGFNDLEGVGVVSALALFSMLMAVVLSVVLFYFKKRKIENYDSCL